MSGSKENFELTFEEKIKEILFNEKIAKKISENIYGLISQDCGSNATSNAVHNHNANPPQTILVCIINDENTNNISVKQRRIDKDIKDQDLIIEEHEKIASMPLAEQIEWEDIQNPLGITIRFNKKPTRVYFMMFLEGWKFATLQQDAITSKLPVSNFYKEYTLMEDHKYIEKIFSIHTNAYFPREGMNRTVVHEYNLHCLANINGIELPIIIDPKFQNP